MKTFLILIFIFISKLGFSQNNTNQPPINYWTSEYGDILKIDSINSYNSALRNCYDFEISGLICYRFDETISCQNQFYNLGIGLDSLTVEKYDFEIIKEAKNKLIVKPVSLLSKEFMTNDVLEFHPFLSKVNSDEFTFIELELKHPGFEIKIDTFRNIYYKRMPHVGLTLRELQRRDTSLDGKYKGKISKEDYEKLILTLKAIGITNYHDFNFVVPCSHCTTTTMTLKYNNVEESYRYNRLKLTHFPFAKVIGSIVKIGDMEKVEDLK